jgi:hypothetical protein
MLVRSIAGDVNAILSPRKSFVSVVECNSEVLQLKENTRKNY